ncbi:MAG: hypothetical protein LBM71_00940 [Elusimicrobiota bacterium]|jgi:tRNA nucleotidyltransferase (CCA-adding enzyme)|nr:hypothetical protein [Elusimicrobiota bacterium]
MIKEQKKILQSIGLVAKKNNIKAWAVGGFARDLYLGKKTFDIDVCAEGNIKLFVDFCIKNFGGSVEYFKTFGTARVVLKNGLKIDFVRCRKEVYPKPASLPKVSPSNLKDDLYRRDFTANAWALSLLPGEFLASYDLFGSQKDIDKKFVRILHSQSFIDDPTRLFRALRFAARFNWVLEPKTKKLFKQAVQNKLPALLSRERVAAELIKILEEKDPAPVFKLMKTYGLTPFIYIGLKYPKIQKNKIKGIIPRLALLALSLGKEGKDFLKSLHLSRLAMGEILPLLDFYVNKEAQLKGLNTSQQKIVKAFDSKLPKSSLKKLVITGGQLQKLGLKGPAINLALNNIAKAQFKGLVNTKAQALKYLKLK